MLLGKYLIGHVDSQVASGAHGCLNFWLCSYVVACLISVHSSTRSLSYNQTSITPGQNPCTTSQTPIPPQCPIFLRAKQHVAGMFRHAPHINTSHHDDIRDALHSTQARHLVKCLRHLSINQQQFRCLSLATNLSEQQTADETPQYTTSTSIRHQTSAIASRQFHQAQTQLLANTPYTLAAAIAEPTQQCRLIIHMPTLSIVHASDAFAQRAVAAEGQLESQRGLHFMSGPSTNANALDVLSAAARGGFKACVTTIVYPNPARPCMARLQVSPLLSHGQVDHALLVLTPLLSDEEQSI